MLAVLWNLPNLLTAARIALIPVFILMVYLPGDWGKIMPTLFFGVAALTDWADGYVARKDGLQTAFGRFFDPVADKLLVISALILLVAEQRAHLLPVLLITAREITIMALREYMSGIGSSLSVSRLGKWKTGFQMTAILMLLVQDGLFGLPLTPVGLLCLYVCMVLTWWSGYDYLTKAWPTIRKSILQV
ncbi:MAG: CDP-diacylglycerol--glycerol-3-phosphate 3-phosphatidyltransferase [Magnetococcales bacterium]|nr:CDP-diacylglycerol--glycerol-3-phosphate 3-phosphatidyltransferase [Magnetococcales bacterium]